MPNNLTLWGVATSRTMRAHWTPRELGLDYQFHPIGSRTAERQTGEFKQLIRGAEFRFFGMGPSCWPTAQLFSIWAEPSALWEGYTSPSDSESRAALNEWRYFIVSELDAGSLRVVRRHEGLKQAYGEAPSAVESAKGYFRHNLQAMVSRLESNNPYLFGERQGAADIFLMTCLDCAVSERISLPEPAARYQKRVAPRPTYQAALATHKV
jgi:glutathione S-transferase